MTGIATLATEDKPSLVHLLPEFIAFPWKLSTKLRSAPTTVSPKLEEDSQAGNTDTFKADGS